LEQNTLNWSLIASLVSSDHLSPELIHYFAMNQAQLPRYEYLTRMIIKNRNTKTVTLKALLDMPRLALSDIIDAEYRKLLIKKLQYEKK
jgi:hypothetical protein